MSTNNNMIGDKLLTILYKNSANAEQAFNFLTASGFNKDDISVIMSDETRNKDFKGADMTEDSLGSKALEGMGVGSAIGGAIGAVAAAIAAVGTTLAFPGLGLVVAGPIAAALAGAGAGSATGGMIGALVGSGMPDEQAKQYENDIKAGGILIGVKTSDERFSELQDELNKLNTYI